MTWTFFMDHANILFSGFGVTLVLVVLSLTIGFFLALLLSYVQECGPRWIRRIALLLSAFLRGTPLLAQLFLVYYGSGEARSFLEKWGMWELFQNAFSCTIFVFSLNSAAYQSEIIRKAVRGVDYDQWQAGESLGMSPSVILWVIIRPQALWQAYRPYGNEVILLIKASAVASVVTVMDLMASTRFIFSKTFDVQTYLWTALLYLLLVGGISKLWTLLEPRWGMPPLQTKKKKICTGF